MARIVQKFGGTSVANPERMRNAASIIAEYRSQGHELVVVVSAMSGVTDSLLKLAREVTSQPSEREMDMLLATGEQASIALMSMTLHGMAIPAVSLTGAQAGIVTDGVHTKARISTITPDRVAQFLKEGNVVIVAGFQGQTMEGQITTLGRGGSDLTAIAMAAALKADLCQIYTDVDGVYTADPRIVPHARKISEISYDEMLEMASSGSKVMQSRSVEFAKKFDVRFEVRSSLTKLPGTIVKEETASMEEVVVRGVSLEKNQAKVNLTGIPDEPGNAAQLFRAIADAHINIDMIVQNLSHPDPSDRSATARTDITFTLNKDDLPKVRKIVEPFAQSKLARGVTVEEGIAKLSVVGIGMRSHSGVAANLFSALAEAGINIQMISTSEIKISVIVDEVRANEAMTAAHDRFHLGK